MQGSPTSCPLWLYISPEGKGIHFHSDPIVHLHLLSFRLVVESLVSKVGIKGAKNLHSLLVSVASRRPLKSCGKGKKTLWPLVVPTKELFSSDALPLQVLPFLDCCGIPQKPPKPRWDSREPGIGVMLQWQSWEENRGPLPFHPILFPSDQST